VGQIESRRIKRVLKPHPDRTSERRTNVERTNEKEKKKMTTQGIRTFYKTCGKGKIMYGPKTLTKDTILRKSPAYKAPKRERTPGWGLLRRGDGD